MTIAELSARHGLHPQGPTPWGDPIPCEAPGVYVVTLDPDPASKRGCAIPAALPAGLHRR